MNSPRTLPCDILTIYFLQDYLFRLVPGYVDSGKGKCSYDPKQENIAVLIRKSRQRGNKITNSFKIPHATESRSLTSVLTSSLPPPPADGNLYAGVHIDFMSTDAALFRTMGGRTAIRTEQYDSRWLNGE